VLVDGALEEASHSGDVAMRREEDVHRATQPVGRPVQILPLAADLDVGVVDPPRRAHRALAAAKGLGQHWHDLQRPAMHRGVIDQHGNSPTSTVIAPGFAARQHLI
jgi:hypothetical protein